MPSESVTIMTEEELAKAMERYNTADDEGRRKIVENLLRQLLAARRNNKTLQKTLMEKLW